MTDVPSKTSNQKSAPDVMLSAADNDRHECSFCGLEFVSEDALYRHQMHDHDPDGIMFSELGLPK